jgi:catalase
MRGLVLRMLMRGVRCSLQVNYQQLPINQPKCPYHNNMHDGAMQMTARDEEVRPDTMRLSAECCD